MNAKKIIAAALCVLSLTAFSLCFQQAQWLAYQGAYQSNGYAALMDDVERELLGGRMNELTAAFHEAIHTGSGLSGLDARSGTYDPNFFYTVRDADGELIASSQVLGDYRAKSMESITVEENREKVVVQETYATYEEREMAVRTLNSQYEEVNAEYMEYSSSSPSTQAPEIEGETPIPEETHDYVYALYAECYLPGEMNTYALSGFLRHELTPSGHIYQEITRAQNLYSYAEFYLATVVAGAVLGVLSLAYLVLTAGNTLRRMDKTLPTDLLVIGWAILGLVVLGLTISRSWSTLFDALLWAPFLALMIALLVLGLLSLVRRARAGVLKENIYFRRLAQTSGTRLNRLCAKGREAWKRLWEKLPLMWVVCTALVVCTLLEWFLVQAISYGNGVHVIWFTLKIVEGAVIIYVGMSLLELQEGGRKLAQGNLNYQIPLEKLHWVFEDHAKNLNSMRQATQAAVEEQMKSERMKTELITNVSHDIKTPLTSIVSYVDLLKKQEMPTEEAKEYLDVLDRQSAKLKKLTEDLVEAAKASTGSMTVEFERTDVNVLLSQSAGEYQERLQSKALQLILTPAQETPEISADGRLLWRVFENLLSNIYKYALPGTRVYLACEKAEEVVTITFRNISATPLNITADELMERFVRGDDSRHTEGSGLGLSIARSLTQLQNGTFDLAVDGDLFKVTLTFPKLP